MLYFFTSAVLHPWPNFSIDVADAAGGIIPTKRQFNEKYTHVANDLLTATACAADAQPKRFTGTMPHD